MVSLTYTPNVRALTDADDSTFRLVARQEIRPLRFRLGARRLPRGSQNRTTSSGRRIETGAPSCTCRCFFGLEIKWCHEWRTGCKRETYSSRPSREKACR